MPVRLAIGGALTLPCIAVSALALRLAEIASTRHLGWPRSPPPAPKPVAALMGTSALSHVRTGYRRTVRGGDADG